ncbi:GerAB/ArcD/ProY family transporter [Alkalicoccobacillus porphyridii]|uniref:GerAB/ArcD/ProY family transporter n=1 Tax=Alkalicoccobacillus porphyridii TaxID=2597270 RepID=A0A554A099_9BACI|nr:GerAB/ArcD/ProY family transporter [Alkalicoccobacillus porphyridii]TSB47066.1 GerAB/ArcD/ProY family transporter [Alkalicoccobacillus porphyridii]
MNTKVDPLSPFQFTVLIINVMLGVGFLILPRRITVSLDSAEGWITLLYSGSIFLIAVLLIFFYFYKHKVGDIVEYTQLAFPSILSKVICILLVLYFSSLAGYEAVAMSEMVRFFLLETTPQMLVVFIILALGAYLASSSFNSLVRVCVFFLPFCLVVVFFIFVLGVREINMNNLLPIFHNGFAPFTRGFFSNSISFLGLESILILTAFTTAQTKRVRAAVIGISFTTILYALTYILVVGTLSFQEVKTLTWPTISFIQTFSIHGIFFERLDSFLLSTWILQFFTICSINLFNCCYILEKLFSIRPIVSCLFIVPIAYFVAYIPADSTEIFLLGNIVSQSGFVILTALPFVCFIIVSIKKKVSA